MGTAAAVITCASGGGPATPASLRWSLRSTAVKQEVFLVTKSLVSLFPPATLLGLSDLGEKNLRSPVKFEFQIKQQILFIVSISQIMHGM